jgi:hypothetical protein
LLELSENGKSEKPEKMEKEKVHNLTYSATHGLGRSFRQSRQDGKRQPFKTPHVRVHRCGGNEGRATRTKPKSTALLSLCVRASCALERHCFFLLSRSLAFFYTLLIVIVIIIIIISLSLSLKSCCWS